MGRVYFVIMITILNAIKTGWHLFNATFAGLGNVTNLFIRCWLAFIYIDSGLEQWGSWQSTLLLFQYEYHVPYINYISAAYLAVGIQLLISPFLILGLGGRIPALILFIFNLMAILSYPFMLTPNGSEMLENHFYWGILLAVILCSGSGKLSLDNLLYYFWSEPKDEALND